MSLSRDSRQEKKLKALLRAQFGLKQRMQRIDWEEDVLHPEVERLKSGKSVLGLPEGVAFDIQVIDEDTDNNAGSTDTTPADATQHSPRKGRRSRAKATHS